MSTDCCLWFVTVMKAICYSFVVLLCVHALRACPAGPQGPIGPQGIQGPQGPRGVQGPTGITNPDADGTGSVGNATLQWGDIYGVNLHGNTLTLGATLTVPSTALQIYKTLGDAHVGTLLYDPTNETLQLTSLHVGGRGLDTPVDLGSFSPTAAALPGDLSVTGTLTVQAISYTPAVPSNWLTPNPTTVDGALDQVASRVNGGVLRHGLSVSGGVTTLDSNLIATDGSGHINFFGFSRPIRGSLPLSSGQTIQAVHVAQGFILYAGANTVLPVDTAVNVCAIRPASSDAVMMVQFVNQGPGDVSLGTSDANTHILTFGDLLHNTTRSLVFRCTGVSPILNVYG